MITKVSKYLPELILLIFTVLVAIGSQIIADFDSLNSIADAKMLSISDSLYYGKSGEAYAVSLKKEIIGKSRFPQRIADAGGMIDTEATNNLLRGSSGCSIIRDYGGVPVLSVWRVVPRNEDNAIGIIAEMDLSESISEVAIPAMCSILIVSLGYYMGFVRRKVSSRKFDFRSIVRSFPDGLLILRDTETGEILEINTNAAKALGYLFSSDIVGKKCNHIFAESLPCTEGGCDLSLIHISEPTRPY